VTEKQEASLDALPTNSSLRSVGKRELILGLSQLVNDDRDTTAKILAYIGEIDRRQLYLEDAYPSMFAMCTKHFRMSESIAAKRIRAGRAACRFPRVLDMIRTGQLHLSGLHQLARHLTDDNVDDVLDRSKYRSMREIDELIAEISPQPDRETLLRELAAEKRNGEGEGFGSGSDVHASLSSGALPANQVKNITVPLSPRRYRLHVTIGHEAKAALEELKELLSHQVPDGDPALIVEKALALLLQETKRRKSAAVKRPRKTPPKSDKRTRAIPTAVRRAVYARDKGRCAFVDDEGKRCRSAWQVEFHHCTPFGREGPHSLENVELRCRAHNQYEADQEYGKAYMAKRRQSA
jgi:hypothetical protein